MANSKKCFQVLMMLGLTLLVFSCKKEENRPTGAYETGVFVVNEGPFQSGTGTITFYDRDQKTVVQDVFSKENNGSVLGNIAQSMSIHKDLGYLVVNNANKIEVVEVATFKSVGKVTGLALPRYFLSISDSKAYVTQWGSNGLDGSVAVIDLASRSVTKTVAVGAGCEQLLLHNGKVYIVLSGGFGNDKRVAVLNPSTDAVEKYIEVGDNPTSLAADAAGNLWVVCRGQTNWTDPTQSTDGGLYKIVGDAVEGLPITLPNGADNLVISSDKKTLFMTAKGQIWSHNVSSANATPTLLINQNVYRLGIDPKTGYLWGADAKNFASPGEIILWKTDGTKINSFESGIVPGGFCFN